MADSLDITKGSLKERIEGFKSLDPNQKAIILAAFALVISTLVVLTVWMNRIEYRVLYSNLSVQDAGNITKNLQDQKIPYKLQDQGATILVPANKLHDLRLELAREGLPKNGHIGYDDMFGKPDFQSSEFVENIKYVRALQGELSKSIDKLEAVDESRVNLSIPRRRVYLDDDEKATASVVIKIRHGFNLNNEEIRGIAFLIAGAVQGLSIDNVTIMSTDGRLLSDFLQQGSLGSSTYQLQIQKDIQANIERKISALLNQTLGEGKSIVKAHVEISKDQKEVKKVVYVPQTENVGVVRSSQTLFEDYQEVEGAAVNRDEPGQIELLDGEVIQEQNPAAQAALRPDYRQRSATTNYEISQTIENEVVVPGEVKKISLGVIIDGASGLTNEQIRSLTDVIASSAGIDRTRGDDLTVRVMNFYKEAEDDLTAEEEEKDMFAKYQRYLIPAAAPLLLLIFAILLTRKKKTKQEKTAADTKTPEKQAPLTQPIVDVRSDQPTDILGAAIREEKMHPEKVRESVRRYARENPKAIAKLLEQWMHEEEPKA